MIEGTLIAESMRVGAELGGVRLRPGLPLFARG